MSATQNDRKNRSERRSQVTIKDGVRSLEPGKDGVRSPESTKNAVRSAENRAGHFLEPFDVSQ
jgi:hypothetical protein